MPDRRFTAEEVDAAVAAITDPERLKHAQEIVTHAAPALQRVLIAALSEGGYLDSSEAKVAEAAQIADPGGRVAALRTMLAEETQLGMLVGASVGFALALELEQPTPTESTAEGAP